MRKKPKTPKSKLKPPPGKKPKTPKSKLKPAPGKRKPAKPRDVIGGFIDR